VRIFTPRSELPFAGHPTIGTAHAVLEAGLVPEKAALRQECAAGLLRLEVSGVGPERLIAVEAPPTAIAALPADAVGTVETAIGARLPEGAPAQIVSLGPRWLTVRLADAATVRALAPDFDAVSRLSRALGITGITVFALERGDGHEVVVRSFAPADGVPEDPVCGSGNAAVGAWLDHAHARVGEGGRYVASQGRELGRDGYVSVRIDATAGRVWIGGRAVTCVEGILRAGPWSTERREAG
jgi:PhzF family phenazine biosynthesis protein